MTPEELMQTRYKVIADWPGVDGKVIVGDILVFDDEAGVFWCYRQAYAEDKLKDYPHLFKKLEWWEKRKPEDMPEYVRVLKDGTFSTLDGDIYDPKAKQITIQFPPVGEIIKVVDAYKWVDLGSRFPIYLISNHNEYVEIHPELILPCTEQEYIEYKKSKNITHG